VRLGDNDLFEGAGMKLTRLEIGLTVVKVALLLIVAGGEASSAPAARQVPAVLRARALEIVDEQGRVRANILVHGPETVNGVRYPETVLFRLMDPTSGPVVKLTAAANGSALSLSDDGGGGVQLYARDTASFVRVVDKSGRRAVLKP
jgi:hypothetical protein